MGGQTGFCGDQVASVSEMVDIGISGHVCVTGGNHTEFEQNNGCNIAGSTCFNVNG